MFIKTLLKSALAACLLLVPAASFATGTSTPASTATVSITATVDAFAEWSTITPAIAASDWTGHFTATNQTQTASVGIHLYANTSTTITPTTGANSGVLTLGSQNLATSYQLVGAGLDNPDAGTSGAYKTADVSGFFNGTNTYTTTYTTGGNSDFACTLMVQAVSPSLSAVQPGDYTCGVVLTASW